jgi:hypothetical protein
MCLCGEKMENYERDSLGMFMKGLQLRTAIVFVDLKQVKRLSNSYVPYVPLW